MHRTGNPPQSGSGQKRRIDAPDEFSVCPLCLRWLPKLCIAAIRRKVPIGDLSRCSKLSQLFDHLVGTTKDREWNSKAKGPGRLEIDDKLNLGHLLDRQVGWSLALENASSVDAHQTERLSQSPSVAHHAPVRDEVARNKIAGSALRGASAASCLL